MSTRKPDPAIVAWDRLQAAEKADCRARDLLDTAEAKARKAGFKVHWPIIRLGEYGCMSVAEMRRNARGLPTAEVADAIKAMRAALVARQRQRRKAGLTPFDNAVERGTRGWRAAMQSMADTRATSTLGVILKMKLVERGVQGGISSYSEGIIASAIADLARMEKRARNRPRPTGL